jgi:diacylglycerol kinase family enzyme
MTVLVLLNRQAGSGMSEVAASLRAAFRRRGVEADLRSVRGPELTAAARRAATEGYEAIVAGGGDGTVSAVAAGLLGSDVPLGVLPLGTLNHFARDAGLPLELDRAIETIARGAVRRVDVGEVNGRTFLNNSSLGLYPRLVRGRERLRREAGLGKWMAMLVALLAGFRRFPLLHVRVEVDGRPLARSETPFVFVGNNRYATDRLRLGGRKRLDEGVLTLFLAGVRSRFGFLRLAVRSLFSGQAPRGLHTEPIAEVWVESRRRRLRVALDGEVTRMRPPLCYRTRPGALALLAPPPGAGAPG